ncbi:MAG: hypothetical protein ACLFSL_01055 [Candidatus Woesearchaeota archaeon]
MIPDNLQRILVTSLLLLLLATATSSAEEGANEEFIFDVMVQNASFISEDKVEFYGDVNTSLSSGNESGSVDAPVNVTLYSYDDPLEVECDISGSGDMEFHCVAENRSNYTIIAVASFDDDKYYRHAEFDQQDIEDELIQEDIKEPEQPDDLNLDVVFKEAYEDARITGEMTSDAVRDDNELLVAIWPTGPDHDGYEDRQTCNYTVPANHDFGCDVNFTESGTYEINVTLISGDMEESVREITYYASPDYTLRLRHEGVYAVGDDVSIESYPLLANREYTDRINLSVESPEGIEYVNRGENPRLVFTADEDGIYEIHAESEHMGDIYTKDSKIVVAAEDMLGSPKERSLLMNVSDFYAVNDKLKIPVDLDGVDDHENLSATIVITDVDGESVEISSVFTEENDEITYLPDQPGRYNIKVQIDDLNLSSTQDIQVLSRMDYARDAVIDPILSRERAKGRSEPINISKISYDEVNSIYDLDLQIGSSSMANLRGINGIDDVSDIQSLKSYNERIATDIFAIDHLNVTDADITLEKEQDEDVQVILRCGDWDYENAKCDSWELTDIDFWQNETHIGFTVDSFSAYAGGDGFDSELLVWDDSSEDYSNETVLIDEDVGFYANYTDFSTGDPIEPATCYINFSDKDGNSTMTYNSSEGTHEYYRQFSEKGNYDYSVQCTSDDNDDLAVSDDIDVNSVSYLDEMSLTRSNLTLGYETGISCRVTDAFSGDGISDYNVDFYSDKEGFLGTQSTDTEGWSSLNFEPDKIGEHNISCTIDDDPEKYYVTGNSVISTYLDVSPSDIFIDKDISMRAFGEYDIELNLTNRENAKIYDVTVGDFVHEDFEASFTDEPDHNATVNLVGQGTMHYWNLGSLDGNATITVDYTISTTELSTFKLGENTVVGGTYHIS